MCAPGRIWRRRVPVLPPPPAGLSTVAMVACCVHHVTDVLPIVGVSLAATILTAWKTPLMGLGLAANFVGIAVMLGLIWRDRRRHRGVR